MEPSLSANTPSTSSPVTDESLVRVVRTAVTARVPRAALRHFAGIDRVPKLGDILLAEISTVGDDDRLESVAFPSAAHTGGTVPFVQPVPGFALLPLTKGQLILCAVGGRYALDYMLAEVPTEPKGHLDLLTFGGVVGTVAARNTHLEKLSTVRPIAYFNDDQNRIVNARDHAPPVSREPAFQGRSVILVVGGSMESGKTTAAAAVVRGLTVRGHAVFAAKVTGCGSFRDPHRIASGGALGTTEFMAFGYPSTHGLSPCELRALFWGVVNLLSAEGARHSPQPLSIVIELADGIGQPETKALLQDDEVRKVVRAAVYAAADPMSARGGLSLLNEWGWPRPIVSGPVASSELGRGEASWAIGGSSLAYLDALAPVDESPSTWRSLEGR